MSSARALACPASLKGVLTAREAAAALAEGLRTWADDVRELPVADGGEGTVDVLHATLGGELHPAHVHDAFGRPREARWLDLPGGVAAVESAEAIPLDPERLDPFAASSRGLGELIQAVGKPRELLVCLGGTANVDGGAGLLEVVHELPAFTRVACDVDVPLVDAARVFSLQKGATAEDAVELERRLVSMPALAPYSDLPGAGAAGGLGAALASLGAELVDLVVTGEGTVDVTTMRGKAPGDVARRCARRGVRCIVFGGRVVEPLRRAETVALSGDPARAREDLVELGSGLGGLGAAG
jgi:glycerate kinase